jgi:hypothetical protein
MRKMSSEFMRLGNTVHISRILRVSIKIIQHRKIRVYHLGCSSSIFKLSLKRNNHAKSFMSTHARAHSGVKLCKPQEKPYDGVTISFRTGRLERELQMI